MGRSVELGLMESTVWGSDRAGTWQVCWLVEGLGKAGTAVELGEVEMVGGNKSWMSRSAELGCTEETTNLGAVRVRTGRGLGKSGGRAWWGRDCGQTGQSRTGWN